jgi:tRNA (Thr-GGU) A37 N-methylase
MGAIEVGPLEAMAGTPIADIKPVISDLPERYGPPNYRTMRYLR